LDQLLGPYELKPFGKEGGQLVLGFTEGFSFGEEPIVLAMFVILADAPEAMHETDILVDLLKTSDGGGFPQPLILRHDVLRVVLQLI
jgi:hypothetical protein